jgi:hypothetical protein
MAFLRNRTVNWINLHSGIQALALGMGGVFVLVFLVRAGVSIPASLCAMALVFAVRFAIRPAVVGLAVRFGLKPLLVSGNLLVALQYPLLAEVRGIGWLLLGYCLLLALGDALYWPAYHAYFASLGDSEHRGHQVSAGVALNAIVGIVAPLIGAWALVSAGPRLAFAAVGVTQALAVVPLIGTPNVAVRREAPGAYGAALGAVFLAAADGWFGGIFVFVWQIALFRSLDQSYSAYGGAMALAALVAAVSGLLLGRHIDAGHGRRAAVVAYSVVAVTLLARAASLGTPWLAVGANALGALAGCLTIPALMTPIYNRAKASPCALRFHVATEGGWDVGTASVCLVSAALVARDVPLSAVIALGFPGAGASLVALRRYYARSDAGLAAISGVR